MVYKLFGKFQPTLPTVRVCSASYSLAGYIMQVK